MYLPQGIRDRVTGTGSFFFGGAAALSIIFGAAAFKVLGVAIAAGALLALFFVEIYREASRLSDENGDLRSKLNTAQNRADLTQDLENRNLKLEELVDDLRGQLRQPAAGLEEILEGIALHLRFLTLVKAHRKLRDEISDAPVTRLELQDENAVTVSAVCTKGCEKLNQQFVSIVETASGQAYGTGSVIAYTTQGITATFDIAEFPMELADELMAQESLTPHGYTLRLAGLCIEKYSDLEDKKIRQLELALGATSEALSNILSGRQVTKDHDLLAELEASIESPEINEIAQPQHRQTATTEVPGDRND
jgi:hypothetical protein